MWRELNYMILVRRYFAGYIFAISKQGRQIQKKGIRIRDSSVSNSFTFQNVIIFDDCTKDIRRSLTNLTNSDEDDGENLYSINANLCKLKTTLHNRRYKIN